MTEIQDVERPLRPRLPGVEDAGDPSHHELHGPVELPPGPEGFSCSLYQSTGVPLKPGHRVELLKNGAVFDRMVEDIHQARQSVHILVYIWKPCPLSDRIIAALAERAAAGVPCRVVVDAVGSQQTAGDKSLDTTVGRRLTEAGVEVHYYRVPASQALGRLLGRTHQKLCILDGRVGYTGGFGIWRAWEGDGRKPDEWRDTHVRVEGPAVVRGFQLCFARHWQEAGGALLPPGEFPEPSETGTSQAGFIDSVGRMGLTEAERMVRIVIAAARQRLWIANAYFTPPDGILEQLEEKCRRGVDVRVLGPGPHSDSALSCAAQRSTYERLLAAGARIYEYQPSMMHAKTLLVDDWLSVVGSTNLDALSLNKLGEGSLVINDARFVRLLEECWRQDMGYSKEVTLETGGRTNPWRRLARRTMSLVGRDH